MSSPKPRRWFNDEPGTESPSPLHRLTRAAAIALWCGPALVLAAGAAPPPLDLTPSRYAPNLEAQVQAGRQRVVGGLDLPVPLWQDPGLLTYAELKGYVSDHQAQEFNLGLGLRWLDHDSRWILGAFGQYDRRNTRYGNVFNQGTLGLEALGSRFDARFNYYNPFDKAKRVQGWVGGIQYQGYRTLTQETFEEPLRGWDAELGALLPIEQVETRVYAGGYGLQGDLNGSATGWKARLEVRPVKSLSLEVSYRDDRLLGAETAFTLRYAFGMPAQRGIRTCVSA